MRYEFDEVIDRRNDPYSFSFKCCQCLINFKGHPYLSNQMNPYKTFKEKMFSKRDMEVSAKEALE